MQFFFDILKVTCFFLRTMGLNANSLREVFFLEEEWKAALCNGNQKEKVEKYALEKKWIHRLKNKKKHESNFFLKKNISGITTTNGYI